MLAGCLTRLNEHQKNPDPWLEAAKRHVTLGNLEEAVRCATVCSGLDRTQGEAKFLINDINSMIETQQAPAETSEEREEPEEVEERERPKPEQAQPSSITKYVEPARCAIPWVPEGERPRFRDEHEAM